MKKGAKANDAEKRCITAISTEEKSRYFQELTFNLQYEDFTVRLETEDGLLLGELDGKRLCHATETGGVRYWKEDVRDNAKGAALDKVTGIIRTAAGYTSQMEAVPQLTVSGLSGDYRLLADFNGIVLAGHPTQHKVQFITWERGRERTGLNAGNYYGPLAGADCCSAAKQNLAVRSGLIPAVQFSRNN